MNRIVYRAVVLLVCLAWAVYAQAPEKDPRVGTWKLNVEKSKYAAGQKAPRTAIRQWAAAPDGATVMTIATVDAAGNPGFTQARFKFDGKEYPVYSNTNLLPALTAAAKTGVTSMKMMDSYTTVATRKD